MSLGVGLGVGLGVPLGLVALWMAASLATGRHAVEQAKYEVVKTYARWELRKYAPCIIAETTVVTGRTDSQETMSTGFRRLAGFIFGKNMGRDGSPHSGGGGGSPQTIAMTSPVVSEPLLNGALASKGRVMRFVMPSQYTSLSALPVPVDPSVTLLEVPERFEAAMLTGSPSSYPSDTDFAANIAALAKLVAAEAHSVAQLMPATGATYVQVENALAIAVAAEDSGASEQQIANMALVAATQATAKGYDPPWTPSFMKRNEVSLTVRLL